MKINISKLKKYIRRMNNPAFEKMDPSYKKKIKSFIKRVGNSSEDGRNICRSISTRLENRVALKQERELARQEYLKTEAYTQPYKWSRKTPRRTA